MKIGNRFLEVNYDDKKHFKNHQNLGYYMPLFNLTGLKSAMTPFFAGDLKTDYHHYALEPASELELFELTQSRNIIFDVDGKKLFFKWTNRNSTTR